LLTDIEKKQKKTLTLKFPGGQLSPAFISASLPARGTAPKIIINRAEPDALISPQGSGHSIMTHVILNSEYEIIEQLANGNWVVLDVDTGKIREISDYYLRNIHQDDYDQKGREMAAWIESGCRM
jgi:hypothetical protein